MRFIATAIGAVLLSSFTWAQTPVPFPDQPPEKQKAQCAQIEQRNVERMQQGLPAVHPYEEICYPAKTFSFTNKPGWKRLRDIGWILRPVVQLTDKQISVDSDAATVTVRCAPGKQEMVAWLIAQLDQPAYVPGQRATGAKVHEMPVPVTEQEQPAKNDEAMRVFFLAHTGTQRGYQEILAILRLIGDFVKLNGDSDQFIFVARAPAAQLDLAAYLIGALDVAPGTTNSSAVFAYTAPDTPFLRRMAKTNAPPASEVVQVFYPDHGTVLRGMQQIVTSPRSVLGTRKIFWDTEVGAIPVRGTPADIATAHWLIESLDIAANPNGTAHADRQLTIPAAPEDDSVIRVFYIGPNTPPAGLAGVLTRLQSDPAMKLSSVDNPPALIVRGSAAQVAQAVSGLQTAR